MEKEKDSDNINSSMEHIEQFVDSVLSCSSRYTTKSSISYAPETLIGKPEHYPSSGDHCGTYMLKTYGKWWKNSEFYQKDYMPQDVNELESEDFIIVKFEYPVRPTRIVIYETYNPGAVVRLWGGCGNGIWKLLWSGLPKISTTGSNLFTPPIRQLTDFIHLVRIEFNQSHLKHHTALDGVLLAGYKMQSDLQMKLLNSFLATFTGTPERDKDVFDPDKYCGFASLPYEIILKIFSYLDLKSLCSCSQVNRTFRQATSDPILYRNLSFKRYWHKVNDEVLRYFMPKCSQLCKLDLSWCGSDNLISEMEFVYFLKNCQSSLTHLSLGNCDFIGKKAIKQISFCSKLIELRLRNMVLENSNVYGYLARLARLKTIDLYLSNINDTALVQILMNTPSLEHLNMDICENIVAWDFVMEIISSYNLKLRAISCWKGRSLSSVGIQFLSKCTHLRELDLGWTFVEANDCLSHIARNCPNLVRLALTGWRSLTDEQLLPIVMNCRKLQQIDLLGNNRLSTDICERLLLNLPELEFLDVSFCDNVSPIRIEQWKMEYKNVTIISQV